MLRPSRCVVLALGLLLLPVCLAPGGSGPPKKEAPPALDLYGDALPSGALARMGTVRLRHGDPPQFVGFLDNQALLSVDSEGLVCVWETATGKELRRFTTDRPSSPSGRAIIALSPDGKLLALLDEQTSVPVVEVATGKERFRFVSPEESDTLFVPEQLAFTDGGKVLVIGGREANQTLVRFLDAATGKELRQIKGAQGNLDAFAATPDGKTLALHDVGTHKVVTWEVPTGKKLREFPTNPKDDNIGLGITADGKKLAIVSPTDQAIYLWDLATAKELLRMPIPAQGPRDFPFSADGKVLALVYTSGIFLHDALTGKEVRRIDPPPTSALGNLLAVTSPPTAAFAPDGKLLAVAGMSHTIRLYDVATGKEVLTFGGHPEGILAITLAPTGKILASLAVDQTVRVWNAETGKELRKLPLLDPDNPEGVGEAAGFAIAFAPDGKTLAAVTPDGTVRLWDALSGKSLRQMGDPQNGVAYSAFALHGKLLATGDRDDVVRLWDLSSGKELRHFKSAQRGGFAGPFLFFGIHPLAFSPNGRILAAARQSGVESDNSLRSVVQLWEMATGKERMRLAARGNMSPCGVIGLRHLRTLPGDPTLLRFAPDGKTLAVGDDHYLSLWDVLRGKEVRQFGGRNVLPESAVFSPDSKLLFAGCQDGKIRFWDLATGTVMGEFQAHRGAVLSLDVSADGKRLISGSLDTTALVWDLPRLLARARTRAKAPTTRRLETLWAELADSRSDRAARALAVLADAPGEALLFFKKHLRPVPPADPKQVARLLADLGSDKFAVRQKATKGLEELGDRAAAALRERLDQHPPLEIRQRIEALLHKLEGPVSSPELLRGLRAVEVLEGIDNAEARQLLQALAKGAAGHRLTEEARAALQRLEKHMP
jgi:WD40 repeat protein